MSIENFTEQQYINIETFRKSGVGVKTPVWFIEKDGKLYTRTEDRSGKVKRLRNNPKVRVAPCKMDGTPLGEWMSATAREVSGPLVEEVKKIYNKKYGLMGLVFFGILGGLRKAHYSIVELSLN